MSRHILHVRVFDNLIAPQRIAITGKGPTNCLRKLVRAGKHGVTAATHFNAGERVSSNIHKLRHQFGIAISTTPEPNADRDGTHARYRLAVRVEIEDHGQQAAA